MKNKFLCLLMVALIALSALASCDSAENPQETESATEGEAESVTEGESATEGESKSEAEGGGETNNEESSLKAKLLSKLHSLLTDHSLDIYDYIPSAMQGAGASISEERIDALDFSDDFVSVSDIPTMGYGEQWQMVLCNLGQSQTFLNVLTVIENVTETSLNLYQKYLDTTNGTIDTYNFVHGAYNIGIDYDGKKLHYVIDFSGEVPLPTPDSLTESFINESMQQMTQLDIQILLSIDLESDERQVRIQLGDANALTYTKAKDRYEFAIKYLGVRRAYFSIEKNEGGDVIGHIYEYITAGSTALRSSAADFYISNDYVTAVGNKARGIIFSGFNCEVYNSKSGALLGYEVVKDKLFGDDDNMIWLDLCAIHGIDTVKAKSDEKLFVNGSEEKWETEDDNYILELRDRYLYVYDEDDGEYDDDECEIPMFGIRKEAYVDLTESVLDELGITVSVAISDTVIQKITDSCDTLVPLFEENLKAFDDQMIIDMIGEKMTFDR